MNATDIVAQVKTVYATCRSYRDDGEDVTVFDPGTSRARVERKPFRTLFVRPDLFFFEFQIRRGSDHWDRYVVWRRGGNARTWWSAMPDCPEQDSLSLALAGATGVSGGSAHSVPRLLLPDEVTGRMTIDSAAKLVPNQEADADSCWVLEQSAGSHVEQLWIDRTSFLIRKIIEPPNEVESRPLAEEQLGELRKTIEERGGDWLEYEAQLRARGRDKFTVESVRTYTPRINIDIDHDEFAFEPPPT